MESLLQDDSTLEEAHLEALLKKGIHKIWVRFSHDLKRQMAQADASQDSEKFKELSQQFLDLQRKLKEFEGSYVSGN
jgi:tartrate dehydratase alpha subunit/fumarate hydratase class I-like protein